MTGAVGIGGCGGWLVTLLVMSSTALLPVHAGPVRPVSIAHTIDMWAEHDDNERFMDVQLRGGVRVDAVSIDGQRIAGLSGLAYDADEDLLYAISDRGVLFHLRAVIEGGQLVGLIGLAAYPLLGESHSPLTGLNADAEGMEILNGRNGRPGDARLVISFERVPRIGHYRPDGRLDGTLKLPVGLDHNRYFRKSNNGIEAITHHPSYGWLVAPEKPKRDDDPNIVPIRSLDGQMSWSYRLAPEPNSALVGMEAWPDGKLVTLERAYGPLFQPIINSIRLARFPAPSSSAASSSAASSPAASSPAASDTQMDVHTVARLDSSQGWFADNFEGLTRHQDDRFFIVSDDNDNLLQSTLLVYLELIPSLPAQSRRD